MIYPAIYISYSLAISFFNDIKRRYATTNRTHLYKTVNLDQLLWDYDPKFAFVDADNYWDSRYLMMRKMGATRLKSTYDFFSCCLTSARTLIENRRKWFSCSFWSFSWSFFLSVASNASCTDAFSLHLNLIVHDVANVLKNWIVKHLI